MKKSNTLRRSALILVSLVVLSTVYVAGYSSGRLSPAAGGTVSLEEARRYQSNYQKNSPITHSGIVNALVIDIEQFNAMADIMQQSSGTTGFRVYYGLNDNNQPVRIVSGFGQSGKDNTSNLIATGAGTSGLCPPVCDSPSGTIGE
jgi:hypothetical protein